MRPVRAVTRNAGRSSSAPDDSTAASAFVISVKASRPARRGLLSIHAAQQKRNRRQQGERANAGGAAAA